MNKPTFDNTFLTFCYKNFDGVLSDALALASRHGKEYCEWNSRIYAIKFGRDTGFILEKHENTLEITNSGW